MRYNRKEGCWTNSSLSLYVFSFSALCPSFFPSPLPSPLQVERMKGRESSGALLFLFCMKRLSHSWLLSQVWSVALSVGEDFDPRKVENDHYAFRSQGKTGAVIIISVIILFAMTEKILPTFRSFCYFHFGRDWVTGKWHDTRVPGFPFISCIQWIRRRWCYCCFALCPPPTKEELSMYPDCSNFSCDT